MTTSPFQILTAHTARDVVGQPSDAQFIKDLAANDKSLRSLLKPGATISEIPVYDGGDRARMVKVLREAGWFITQEFPPGCIHVSLR
jgi:hypothetical protein